MLSKDEKLSILARLAAEFHKQHLIWAVGASLLLYLKGYADDFHDIDIMVQEADAETMEAILRSLGTMQPSDKGNFATKHFREFIIDGAEVDMIGGFAIISGGKVHNCDLKPTEITEYAEVAGQKIPLHSLSLWRTYYALMGRENKVAIIDQNKQPHPLR